MTEYLIPTEHRVSLLKRKLPSVSRNLTLLIPLAAISVPSLFAAGTRTHPWELQEITLRAAKDYPNPYTDVMCWVQLKGPGFSERIYGFWDGGNIWRVRIVATSAGQWTWTSGSESPGDNGLNGKTGSFTAENWTEAEKEQNPNRHGFLRPTPNHHALQYADGTPFFLVGDTWIGAATWRLPFTGAKPDPAYEPAPAITFENAVAYDITTTDEPPGARPYIWTALKYTAGGQMQWMKKFFLSEGRRYQDLLLANDEITPRKAPGSPEDGLDGWSLMMRTKEKDLAFLYFENKAIRARLAGWVPGKSYRLTWYDPRKGEWASAAEVTSDA